MKINNSKIYDSLKWTQRILLPALIAFWLTLGDIWNLPYVTEIGATASAFVVFLGAVLGMSNANYHAEAEATQIAIDEDGDADYTEIEESEEVIDNGITID